MAARKRRSPTGNVVLRDESDERGTRFLGASLRADGAVVIEGHDLGRGVEGFFGSGLTEYEWAWTISAEDVPRLRTALGGKRDADVLDLLAARFAAPNAGNLTSFLKEHDVSYAVWSRVGE